MCSLWLSLCARYIATHMNHEEYSNVLRNVYKAHQETWSHGEGPLYNVSKISKYEVFDSSFMVT